MRWIWILGLVILIGCDEGSDQLQDEYFTFTNCPLKKGKIVAFNRPLYTHCILPSRGIRIVGQEASIYSFADGIVTVVEEIKGLKGLIIIVEDSDGIRAVYTNLKEKNVSIGDQVRKGTKLGDLYQEDDGSFRTEFSLWESKSVLDTEKFVNCECCSEL